jgi:hypothetical protein
MADKVWGDIFIEVVHSIWGALTFIDEFNSSAFVSSLFISSDDLDINAKVARERADEYIKTANELIKTLMGYKPPSTTEQSSPEFWWTSNEKYELAKEKLGVLQGWVDVIQNLQLSINSFKAPGHRAMRTGLLTFKKECITAITGLNQMIEFYNRSVLQKHPTYGLDKINMSTGAK